MKNLVLYAKQVKTKLFINLSTLSVYGEIRKKLLNENYAPVNQSWLGITKFRAEKFLKISSINYINLRLPGVLTINKNFIRPWLKTLILKIKTKKKY